MKFFWRAKKIGLIMIFSFFVSSFLGTLVYAQPTTINCEKDYCPLTTIPGVFEEKKSVNPIEIVKKIYGISIGIGAILAVIMIIWAGIQYATTEAITGKSDAKERWQGALWGLTLLLASYLILRTVNVDLVNINFKDILNNPIKGTTGVESGSLEKIVKAANESAVSYQRSLQVVNNTQKSLDELKAEHKKLSDQWKGKNMATEEGRAASAKLVELESKIKESAQQNLSAQIESKLESIKNKSLSAFLSVTSKAITHGEIATAQNLANITKKLVQDELKTLQALKAPADKIKTATDQINATNNILAQIITAGKVLQSDSPSRASGKNYFGFNSPVASERRKLVESAANPHMNSILNAFDNRVAKKLNCLEGRGVFIQSNNSIACKQ